VLDAHANEALCDGDGVLWDELLEGDEEGGLDGDAARDCGAATRISTGDGGRWTVGGGQAYSGVVLLLMR
jgi:hypothetical protein